MELLTAKTPGDRILTFSALVCYVGVHMSTSEKICRSVVTLFRRLNFRSTWNNFVGDKTEEAPNGTINSIARRLLEMSYGNRQRRASAAPSASSLSDPETPMEVDILPTEEVPTTTTAKPVEGALSLAVPLPEAEVDLPPLSELLNVGCLWTYLSLCLTELEKTGDQNAVLILQPTVESFFLVHATEKRNADRRDSTTRAHPAGGQQVSVVSKKISVCCRANS